MSNLDYSLPYANYYEYKLDGYDKDWVKQTGVNEVIYRNLPSGKYIFKIRASEKMCIRDSYKHVKGMNAPYSKKFAEKYRPATSIHPFEYDDDFPGIGTLMFYKGE